jgi:UDP-N-acetylmuramate--alanine ligase
VMCLDDPVIAESLSQVPRPVLTYGLSQGADVRARNIRQRQATTQFTVVNRQGVELEITLSLAGQHNVLNALAAIAVAQELGVEDATIQRALAGFQGIGRRFQLYGEITTAAGSVLMIDDYGHHPREIAATVQAVRAGWPQRRLVAVFQPHRYSRTRDLFEDFVKVLSEIDVLLLLEVYPAGEEPISAADGRALSRAVRARGQVDPVFVDTLADLPAVLRSVLQDGDVLLTSGAGDIGAAAAKLPEQLREGAS